MIQRRHDPGCRQLRIQANHRAFSRLDGAKWAIVVFAVLEKGRDDRQRSGPGFGGLAT